jgi:hypothetical protein
MKPTAQKRPVNGHSRGKPASDPHSLEDRRHLAILRWLTNRFDLKSDPRSPRHLTSV